MHRLLSGVTTDPATPVLEVAPGALLRHMPVLSLVPLVVVVAVVHSLVPRLGLALHLMVVERRSCDRISGRPRVLAHTHRSNCASGVIYCEDCGDSGRL